MKDATGSGSPCCALIFLAWHVPLAYRTEAGPG